MSYYCVHNLDEFWWKNFKWFLRIESQKRNIYHVKQFVTNETSKLAISVFINGIVEYLHDWTNEKPGTLSKCQVVLNLSQPIYFQ